MQITGRRIYTNDTGGLVFELPGDYGCDLNGNWWARPPEVGFVAGRLHEHHVTEHENGTITVSPSIIAEGLQGKSWHGYLVAGVWEKIG